MKYRKIRGHKRRQKHIQKWIDNESVFSLEMLKSRKYWYSKVSVYPWNSLSLIKSQFSEPKAETRNQIIRGLEKIYNNWKLELDKLNEPYYLKIWLYEPRVSKSQVVCAVGERILHYENIFNKIEYSYKRLGFYTKINSDFRWDLFSDEEFNDEENLCYLKGKIWVGGK